MSADLANRILDNIDLGIIVVDTEERIILFNPAAQVATGWSERQARGRPCGDILSVGDKLKRLIGEALARGRSISSPDRLILRRADGGELPVNMSVSPLLDTDGSLQGATVILKDLRQLVSLEESARSSDRMNTIDTLAAGLAHEIRNPLGGIRGAAQLLAKELADRADLAEYTEVMVREVDRVSGILEELANLTRPRPLKTGAVDLTSLLDRIILLERQAHAADAIEFILQVDPSIPPIEGDEEMLHRLFLNLIRNAAEAIGNNGRVRVGTRIRPDLRLHRPDGRPVPLVEITVSDNGPGIPAEVEKRIFTPFFTTKKQGTGLGLSICQRIVTEHHGMIQLKTRPGHGSTFTVSLPLTSPGNKEA
ncbi:MAG: nitrogen fixation sensor histidine kinase GnfL [Geothermobacteraceae bacterium]